MIDLDLATSANMKQISFHGSEKNQVIIFAIDLMIITERYASKMLILNALNIPDMYLIIKLSNQDFFF